jgi:hypothetical protein
MIQCGNIVELVNAVLNTDKPLNGWAYTAMKQWLDNPNSAVFYLISEDEIDDLDDDDVYEADFGGYLPIALKELNLYPWLETDTLGGILENASVGVNPSDKDVETFILAVNHYREFDGFFTAS